MCGDKKVPASVWVKGRSYLAQSGVNHVGIYTSGFSDFQDWHSHNKAFASTGQN